MATTITLLTKKRFMPLFVTVFAGSLNDNIFKNALIIWYAYDVAVKLGVNPGPMLSLASGLFVLPFFLFSATAGIMADKFERSKLTRMIKWVELLLMVLVIVGFYVQSATFLVMVLFLMGAQSAFFGPIKYSLLPVHLPKDELMAGNGLVEAGTFISLLLGTIIGSLIILTDHGVLWLALLLLCLSVIGIISSYLIPYAKISDATLTVRYNIMAQTWGVISDAKTNKFIWLVMFSMAWFWFMAAMFLMQLPTYTKLVIGADQTVVTLFLVMFSVGIGIGSLLCTKLLGRQLSAKYIPHLLVAIGAIIGCFILVTYYYSHTIMMPPQDALMTIGHFITLGVPAYAIMVSLFMLSFVSGMYVVPLYALLQHYGKGPKLGQMIGACNIINSLFVVSASILAMVLFSFGFNVVTILLVTGVTSLIIFPVALGAKRLQASNVG